MPDTITKMKSTVSLMYDATSADNEPFNDSVPISDLIRYLQRIQSERGDIEAYIRITPIQFPNPKVQ